ILCIVVFLGAVGTVSAQEAKSYIVTFKDPSKVEIEREQKQPNKSLVETQSLRVQKRQIKDRQQLRIEEIQNKILNRKQQKVNKFSIAVNGIAAEFTQEEIDQLKSLSY